MARLRTTVKQYNSLLTWETEGTPPTQDGSGNIIPGVPGETVTARCRFENYLSGNRREYTGRDGKTVLATGKILIKFGEPVPPRFFVGTVTKAEGGEIYKGEVINPYEGQMNSTVYPIEDVRD
jgi:hypothetical protein